VEKRRLVAIVDDEKAVCRAIGRLVISAGFESETFPSAEEFLRSCRESTPDCLILDLVCAGRTALNCRNNSPHIAAESRSSSYRLTTTQRPVDGLSRVARLDSAESPLTMKPCLKPYIQQ
jgi:DNA-binding NtrC family response regulator